MSFQLNLALANFYIYKSTKLLELHIITRELSITLPYKNVEYFGPHINDHHQGSTDKVNLTNYTWDSFIYPMHERKNIKTSRWWLQYSPESNFLFLTFPPSKYTAITGQMWTEQCNQSHRHLPQQALGQSSRLRAYFTTHPSGSYAYSPHLPLRYVVRRPSEASFKIHKMLFHKNPINLPSYCSKSWKDVVMFSKIRLATWVKFFPLIFSSVTLCLISCQRTWPWIPSSQINYFLNNVFLFYESFKIKRFE